MDAYVFVLIMHVAVANYGPADTVLSAWSTHEGCLVAAGFFAEDDRRIHVTGSSYECKKVPFNTPAKSR